MMEIPESDSPSYPLETDTVEGEDVVLLAPVDYGDFYTDTESVPLDDFDKEVLSDIITA